MAPVKAPRSWPKSSLSRRPVGMAAQLSFMRVRSLRRLRSWIAWAISSLPVPVSPSRSTVESLVATISTSCNTCRSAELCPTIPSKSATAPMFSPKLRSSFTVLESGTVVSVAGTVDPESLRCASENAKPVEAMTILQMLLACTHTVCWSPCSIAARSTRGCTVHNCAFRLLTRYVLFQLGIRPAIHGKIRPGNVRGLWTGDKRHQRSDLIDVPVAVECRGGLLRYRPIARGGIQLRVDRTRLHVVDRDAPAPDLSGQTLSKYFHGSLRGRVGHKPGNQDTLTHGRANHDDATAALHVLQRRLRSDEYPADVDVDHAIQLLQRGLLEPLGNGRAGIVHKHIEPAKCRHGLFDRGFDGVGISGVRLNCDRLSAGAFNLLNDRRGRVGTFRVCDGHVRSVRSKTLGDCGTNTARAARNECNLSFQFLRHCCSPIPSISLFADPVAYVRRAVEERDPLCFTSPEETNNLDIDQVHLLQIDYDLRSALPNLLLQFSQMFRLHSPNESNRRAGPFGISFDLQGHIRPVWRFTSERIAIPVPFVTT